MARSLSLSLSLSLSVSLSLSLSLSTPAVCSQLSQMRETSFEAAVAHSNQSDCKTSGSEAKGARRWSEETVDLTTDNAGARNWAAGARRFYFDQANWGPTADWSSLQQQAFIEQFKFFDLALVPEHKKGPWRRVQCSSSQRHAFDRFMEQCRSEQREEFRCEPTE
jgi:hypothetical protein